MDGRYVIVAHIYGAFYAFEDRCPHQGLPMTNCFFTSGDVVCAWHGAAFDLKTGLERGPDNDGPLTMFAVRIEGDEVQVSLTAPPATSTSRTAGET